METPGVVSNPIADICRQDTFDEVVFTDAEIPVADRLGGEGEGWVVAMGTLGHERVGTGGIAIGLRAELERMVAVAREHNPDALADPGLRERVARMHAQIELTRLLNARALSKVLKGEKTWPEVPIAKLQWSHPSQSLAELAIDLLGPLGVLAKGGPDTVDSGHAAHNFPWQRFTSIGAGATEVQKNIIADRAIKLPRR
jgi:alkylation response protein AidB-like acyl-CoA dehydrogenase